jgi:hypothetical protein
MDKHEIMETVLIFRSEELEELMQFRQKSYWDWLGILDRGLRKENIEIGMFLDQIAINEHILD